MKHLLLGTQYLSPYFPLPSSILPPFLPSLHNSFTHFLFPHLFFTNSFHSSFLLSFILSSFLLVFHARRSGSMTKIQSPSSTARGTSEVIANGNTMKPSVFFISSSSSRFFFLPFFLFFLYTMFFLLTPFLLKICFAFHLFIIHSYFFLNSF